MSFRRRLLLLFALSVILSVAAVTIIVSVMTRRAFDRSNDDRTAALVSQFQREFARRGEDVSRKIHSVAASADATRIAVEAARPAPEYSTFLDTAQVMAESQQLNFLEFADDRGTIISSAQWPAKFGYIEPLAKSAVPSAAFLKEDETPAGPALGLFAVRSITAADRRLYIIGGIRLDKSFLATLDLPSGMRVMLYENLDHHAITFSPAHLFSVSDLPGSSQELAALVEQVQRNHSEATTIVHWNSQATSGSGESVTAFPLVGPAEDDQLLGILLVGSSRQAYVDLRNQIRSAALIAAAAGLLLAIVLSSWAAARVTRPVEELARAARQVAAGDWTAQVARNSSNDDEIGQLADSFNRMTRELLEKQERLVQSERVAAWRDLARRLAHELKNPLFPLQLTVENLLRARELSQQQFDETFRESASTLLSEISNLKTIIGRFSDFSKMPQPKLQPLRLDDVVKEAVKLHLSQFTKANIVCRLELSGQETISADPELLHRALSNLILNAIEAMPEGGNLTLRTRRQEDSACIEVSDTGKGLAPEECARLFTPYYTSKPHGTGLGLAIVQSIVSDHGGKINVQSEPGRGTTFIIELPANHGHDSAAQGQNV